MYYNHSNVHLARNLRKSMTPWERKLWYCFLKAYPLRFQRQKIIGNYIADFFCAKAGLVVELDGSGHYTEKTIKSDISRTVEIENNGYKVIRFCNLDIDRNFYSVCSAIDEEIKKRI